jgi:hypothetical protein
MGVLVYFALNTFSEASQPNTRQGKQSEYKHFELEQQEMALTSRHLGTGNAGASYCSPHHENKSEQWLLWAGPLELPIPGTRLEVFADIVVR